MMPDYFDLNKRANKAKVNEVIENIQYQAADLGYSEKFSDEQKENIEFLMMDLIKKGPIEKTRPRPIQDDDKSDELEGLSFHDEYDLEMERAVIGESSPRHDREDIEITSLPSLATASLQMGASNNMSPGHQLFMYLGVLFGIILSTTVNQFQAGVDFTFSMNLPEFLISGVVALMLIPSVYEKLRMNPGQPFMVQFGIFVQSGVFWNVMIKAIGTAV